MFRKSICLFMTVIMLLALAAVPATAEDAFTLRNGIRFGDSMATVREKETLPFKEDECTQERLWTQKGTVAGIANVRIEYIFSADKLQEVVWEKGAFLSTAAAGLFMIPPSAAPFAKSCRPFLISSASSAVRKIRP